MADYTANLTPLMRDMATPGSLLIPKKIYDTLLPEVKKELLPRELAAILVGPKGCPGSSLDFNLVKEDSMKVFRVAEGVAVPMDNPAYLSRNFKPVKYGVRPFISKEMSEDGKFDLLANALAVAGREFAENENDLIEAALGNATNTVTGSTSLTIANITRAMQYLEDENYKPTDLVIGTECLNDLRNLDVFLHTEKAGGLDIKKTGFIKTFMGMKVWHVGSTWTSGYAYVLDRNHAFAIVEKRPLTVNRYNIPENDMSGAVLTTRIKVDYLRADAICKITTT